MISLALVIGSVTLGLGVQTFAQLYVAHAGCLHVLAALGGIAGTVLFVTPTVAWAIATLPLELVRAVVVAVLLVLATVVVIVRPGE